MIDVVPSFDDFSKLCELQVAKVMGGYWIYHREFEETVNILQKKGMNRLKQADYARKATQNMATTILAYNPFRRSRKNIETLIVAYVMLDYHVNRLGLKLPKNHDNLVYATWYLNDHKPEAKQ